MKVDITFKPNGTARIILEGLEEEFDFVFMPDVEEAIFDAFEAQVAASRGATN